MHGWDRQTGLYGPWTCLAVKRPLSVDDGGFFKVPQMDQDLLYLFFIWWMLIKSWKKFWNQSYFFHQGFYAHSPVKINLSDYTVREYETWHLVNIPVYSATCHSLCSQPNYLHHKTACTGCMCYCICTDSNATDFSKTLHFQTTTHHSNKVLVCFLFWRYKTIFFQLI